MKLQQMTFEQIYLEFYNNFLTIERMAEFYNVQPDFLAYCIKLGKLQNN